MIELNLLPKKLRRKKRRTTAVQLPNIPVIPIALGLVAFLICTHIILMLLTFHSKAVYKRSVQTWKEMEPQKNKTEKVITETAELERKINVMKKIEKPDLDWARLLSGLNLAMMPNVWLATFDLVFPGSKSASKLTDISGPPQSLQLTGYGLGNSQEATSTVAKFINSLKDQKDFAEFFREIELNNMRTGVVAGEEVMVFKLECVFRKLTPAPAAKKAQK